MLLLSSFFYNEFNKALDERILLQLTSIKRLKRVQIENYLHKKWEHFEESDQSMFPHFDSLTYVDTLQIKELLTQANQQRTSLKGIYDLTNQSASGEFLLLFIGSTKNNHSKAAWLYPVEISHILRERTGMGQTGETYLVGEDHRLRSESRFFPEKPPFSIEAKTVGVLKALENINGKSIIKDYRGVRVYSAFHSLEVMGLRLAILSEIDVEEALIPIHSMKSKLLRISLAVLSFGVLTSILIAWLLSRPVRLVQGFINQIAQGRQSIKIPKHSKLLEINETFSSLEQLKQAMEQLVKFSSEIGSMNLRATFEPRSIHDSLGHSLLQMRDRLREFNNKAKKSEQLARQSLLKGQENERQRLAKELHDGLGPFLTTLKLKIQSSNIENVLKSQIKAMIDETIIEVRRMTYNLMPQSLIDFGISEAINQMIESLKNSTDVDILYEIDSSAKVKVPDGISIAVFRIVQELINNTLKHAQASKIRLSLSLFSDKISLYYGDDGKGFDVNKAEKGLGIQNIKERIDAFDGFLAIQSSSNGIRVEIEIPI